MKLETVTISNFRCFGPDPVEIELEEAVTVFIGNNGSGKTAIFQALSRMFGVTREQKTVRKSDFHLPVDQVSIADGAQLYVDCVLSFPELEADEDDPSVPDVFQQMSATGVGESLNVRIRLEATWNDDGSPEGNVTEELRWITTLRDDFEWDKCAKVQGGERGLVQLIYVPASRNASEQVSTLLKSRLWKAANWSDDLREITETRSQDIQEQFVGEAPTKFVATKLKRRWEQLHKGDTHAEPNLRLIDSRVEELLRKAEFFFEPSKGAGLRDLRDLSDGQRSLFHIALTAATLEMERDAISTPAGKAAFDQEKAKSTSLTILVLEEPENSLSPFFLSRIMLQARDIGEMAAAQVLVSSHSASILARVDAEEVRHTRLNARTRRSKVTQLKLPRKDKDARQYVRLAVKSYPELYFARFVVLAEGVSEQIILPRLAEAMGITLDRSFVPIVPLGGRYVDHFWKLLSGLGIPFATLIDLDVGRQHGGAKTIKTVVQALSEIGEDLKLNSSVINGDVSLDELDDISDMDLLDKDQDHPWIVALREEGVFFSSPIDIDFSMLLTMGDPYKVIPKGGRLPASDDVSIENRKRRTLKKNGNTALYRNRFGGAFDWYPRLFLDGSKPEAHLTALSSVSEEKLRRSSPEALDFLLEHVKTKLGI